MSSSPECKSCGDYIHGGLVICEGCISKRLTTAREAGAREMRERCAAVVNEARGTSYDLRGIAAAINALPLTPTKEPADG